MTSTRTGPDPTAQDVTAPTRAEADRPWAPRPRGRHRRPRPRKVLFAAGGLALAAGVLSLVRLTSDPGGPAGVGAAGADPQPDPVASTGDDTGADTGAGVGPGRSVDTAATVAPSPSAPSAMGGASAGPAGEAGLLPGAPGSPTSVALTPGATYAPAGPGPAATRHADEPPHAPDAPRPTPTSGTAAPRPSAPAPAPATTPPAPQPSSTGTPRRPGVCVPVVGLCVDPLAAPLPKL
ncbi:hypothetical protein [Streptomyces hilarionis]|uniref:hypothetical protein n=1 Tax=Streptomyces hilarionis TaxID=2839954 RepID=UPI00211A80A2|nr:hypothetical protein [Streptomyces hilarionis]